MQLQEEPPWGGNKRRRGFCCMRQRLADCDFKPAAPHPAYPIKRRTSAQRTQAIRLRPLAARNERSFGDRRCKEAKNLQHGFRHEYRAFERRSPREIGYGRRYHLTSSECGTSRVSVRCRCRCKRSKQTALPAHRRIDRRQRQRA